MDLRDIVKKKKELEGEIYTKLKIFERETGVYVQDIDLNVYHNMTMGGIESSTINNVRVKVDILN